VKLARLRRPKIACTPSNVDYRPKTNAVIIGHGPHTKERMCMGEIWKGKET
jgi:hypothetical protein